MIEEQKFYWTLLDTLKDGVYFADKNRKITYWNKAAEKITGYKNNEMLGRHCGDNLLVHIDQHGNNLCNSSCPLSRSIETSEPYEEKIFLHHKDGHRVPVLVRVTPVQDAQGQAIGAVEIFTDLSSKEALLKDLQILARPDLHNPLTGLPTRQYLEMHLKLKLVEWNEFKHPFGIFIIRVEGMEKIKSTYAQDTFENILKILANTLSHNVEPCDFAGEWAEGEYLGIVGHADEIRLTKNTNYYRLLMEKSVLPSADKPISLNFSQTTYLVQPGDTFDFLMKKV